MDYNKEKFKSLLSYVISRCENKKNVGKTVLCKLLYFSDFDYYEIYEKPITNETYIKFERGPLPKHFLDVTNEMIKNNELELIKEPYHNNYIHRYYLKNAPNLSILSTDELLVINSVIDKLSDKNAKEISEYSHGDMPWIVAEDQEELDYEFVFYRDDDYSVRVYDDN